MAAATKYQCVLFFFNLVLLALGIFIMYAGITKIDPDYSDIFNELVNGKFFTVAIASGTFLILVSLCGCYATKSAKQVIRRDNCSISMCVYGTLVLTTLVLVATAFGFFVTAHVYLNTESDISFNAENPSPFDNATMTILADFPDQWIVIQDDFSCCGWGVITDELATGSLCFNESATSAPKPCRDPLTAWVSDVAEGAMWGTGAAMMVMLCVMTSVCCLSCCSKPQDASNNPYHSMPTASGAGYV